MKKKYLSILLVSIVILTSCYTGTNRKILLNVASYNIRHGLGTDNKFDLNRIADVIKKMNPDVIALQEIDNNVDRTYKKNIAGILANLLNMDYRFAKFMDYQGGKYGMAILSKYKIEETIIHSLPEGGEPRVALEIKIKVNGYKKLVSFIGIHNDWINEEIRIAQVKTLLEKIKNYNNPIILAGDFNCERNSESFKLFKKDVWNIVDKENKKTWNSENPTVEIDYFVINKFVKDKKINKVIKETKASDHRPIFSTFELK